MARSQVLALVCATAVWGLPASAVAQAESTEDLAAASGASAREEIVVTASRLEEPRRRAPAAVDELGPSRLETPTGAALVEALRFLPGLEVFQSGGPGRVSSVQLRGGNTSHTLVLLDGVRLTSATTAQFDLADLRGTELERVEVVRGPQSAVWGSEAIGGVVNLISAAAPAGLSGRLRGGVGEGSMATVGASVGHGSDRFGLRLGLDAEEGRLLSVADERGGSSEKDHHRVAQAALRADFTLDSSRSAGVSLRHVDSGADLDGFDFPAGPVDDLDATQARTLGALAASFAQAGRSLVLSARFGAVDESLVGEDPTTFFNNFEIDSTTAELALQGDFTWSAGIGTVGGSAERRRGANRGNFDERVDLRSAFAQQRVDVGPCLVSLGARHDDHESFGGATTARFGTSCAVGDHWVARLAWGTGFRAPALNELVFPFYGNPDLDPERSRGGDLGLSWSDGRTEVALTAFSQRFRDLIGTGPTFTAVNVHRARTEGLEATVRTRFSTLVLDGSYTFLESEDEATGIALPQRPRHRATAWLDWTATQWISIHLGVLVVADRVGPTEVSLEDYQRVDLGVRTRLRRDFDLEIGVGNLFDEDYQEVAGYGTTGRLGRVALAWRW